MQLPRSDEDWEATWAPYDHATYDAVLAQIGPTDRILEIGAGDFRLARRMASIAREVIGIEIQPWLVDLARQEQQANYLPNLTILPGDARSLPFPPGITTGVLLMRYCTHFQEYAEKLKAAGCARLITNARWRMSVEVVDLRALRDIFANLAIGWYACWCGHTGFKAGPVEALTENLETQIHETQNCPACAPPHMGV